MLSLKTFKTGAACAVALALALTKTEAQTANWIGASGGEWNTVANWDIGLPGPGTNAMIGSSSLTVNYNLPMLASGFGVLTDYGVLNVNTNGFNNTGILLVRPGGGDKLLVNTGGVVTVTGNVALCSNSVVNVSGGAVLNMSGTLLIGSSGAGTTSGGTVTSYGIVTNSGGTLLASATSLNPENESITSGCLLVIGGGTNNLGTVSVKRSSAGSGGYSTLGAEGLVIYGGQVTMTNLNVGGGSGNSYLSTLIAGGAVTNIGSVSINQGSSGRGSRLLQTGGLFVVPDPGVINPNPTVSGSLNVYSVTGGTNIVGGFYFGNSNATAGTINFTNGAAIYIGSQGIASNGVATVNAVLKGGSLMGATTGWTSSVPLSVSSGLVTFQAADPNGNPNPITLDGVLSGPGGVAKTGTGDLVVGAAATYTGNTYIGAGTLTLVPGGSVASANLFVNGGATLDVSQDAGYTLNAGQTLAGSGTVNGAVAVAASATLYPGSNLITGTLTFPGGITETGGAVNEFNLSSNPSGPNNDFIVASGGLNVSGVNTILINGSVTGGGVYPLIQYSSLVGGTNNFSVSGASGYISNSVSAQEIYFIAQATLRGPTNTVWVGNALNNNWDTEISTNWLNAGVLNFFVPGDNVQFNNLGGTNSQVNLVGTVTPGSITVNITTTSNYTFTGSGNLGGTGGLTVSNGLVTILTTNIYTGPTILDGGVLATPNLANSGSPSGIGAATADPGNVIFNGGTLAYLGASVGIDHNITLTNGGGTFDVTNGTTLTLNGVLGGSGGLTEIDSGTLTLANANSYTGNTTISNGTLTLNNALGAGAGNIVLAGGTLSLTVGSQPTYANNLTVTANSTLNSAGGNNNILSGAWTSPTNTTLNLLIAGTGTFSVNGNLTNFLGTVELGNDSGYFRFNAGGGNTSFGAPNATIDAGSNNVVIEARNPGTIAIGTLQGGSSTYLKGPSSTAGLLIWQIGATSNNASSTYFGTVSDNSGNEFSGILKVGSGTLALAGQDTYSGPTTVSAGVLALTNNPFTGSDGTLFFSTNINILAGAILDVSGRSDGTFYLGLYASQTLQGSGTINGQLYTYNGTVAPGNGLSGATGILTITNDVQLNATAWLKLNRGSTPNSDRIVSSLSTITYGGTLVVTNVGAPLQVGDTFTLFSGSGLSAGSFGTIVLPDYYTFDTSNLGVNGTIRVTGATKPALSQVDFSQLANGTITFNATNGIPNGGFAILSTTNLLLPLNQWTTVATGNFDGNGDLTGETVTANPAQTQEYYILQGQ